MRAQPGGRLSPCWSASCRSCRSGRATRTIISVARKRINPNRPADRVPKRPASSTAQSSGSAVTRSGGETRTLNHTINSRVLCRLSYPGIQREAYPGRWWSRSWMTALALAEVSDLRGKKGGCGSRQGSWWDAQPAST